jgi:hypothetical protein
VNNHGEREKQHGKAGLDLNQRPLGYPCPKTRGSWPGDSPIGPVAAVLDMYGYLPYVRAWVSAGGHYAQD